jgi:hypothetical protein
MPHHHTIGPPVTAALFYARDLGWAVAPGCHQTNQTHRDYLDYTRCRRSDCAAAEPHPADGPGDLAATRDAALIGAWWQRMPGAPVLLAVGQRFDLLDIPGHAAPEALPSLTLTGYRLGPVAQTRGDRVLVWVRADTRVLADAHERLRWPYADLDLHVRGVGDYILAPPCGGTRWLNPPIPYTEPTLPHCADIIGVIAHTCRQLKPSHAGRQPVPAPARA